MPEPVRTSTASSTSSAISASRLEFAVGDQRAQLFRDLPVQALRFDGLQRHGTIRCWMGGEKLAKWPDQLY
jgi:hypothetical protein